MTTAPIVDEPIGSDGLTARERAKVPLGSEALLQQQEDVVLPAELVVPASALKRVLAATAFAAKYHRHQQRKNAERTPYVNHPIRVALNLARAGVTDDDVLVAALLHDTVEDTTATIEDVRAAFGDRVASIVAEVTDDKSLPKDERKRLQIVNAPHKSAEAKLVKLADKLDNLGDLLNEIPQGWGVIRVRGYFAWAHAVIAGLRGTNAWLEDAIDRLFGSLCLFNPTMRAYDPHADNAALLEAYLASMAAAKN